MIFLAMWISGEKFTNNLIRSYGMIPRDIIYGVRLHTLVTSMFLHEDILHLVGNMLYLYVFGDNVEDALGHARYFIFYILCGVIASLIYVSSTVFMGGIRTITIGASGAISGVLGAYLVLYPRARILTFALFFIVPVPAILFLGFWFILQWLYVLLQVASDVAYWAHIGGFLAGMSLVPSFVKKRKKQAGFQSFKGFSFL